MSAAAVIHRRLLGGGAWLRSALEAAAVAASVQADRAQLLFRLAGSSPCVVGDWPRIDLLVLKDGIGTCVKELWHAPTHRGGAVYGAARGSKKDNNNALTHCIHSVVHVLSCIT